MFRLHRLIPSPAMAVAVAALVVAIGGQAAYATATNFLLNTSNTSTAQTTLKGSAVAGTALQVTNVNPATGATALGLSVGSGHPPFTVNSNTQVPKLNATLLQGIGAGGFVQGKGSTYTNSVEVALGTTSPVEDVAPGFVTVALGCVNSQGGPEAGVEITNASSQPENLFVTGDGDFGTLQPGNVDAVYALNPGLLDTFSVQGNPSGTAEVVSNIVVGGDYRTTPNDCHFQVQGLTTHQ